MAFLQTLCILKTCVTVRVILIFEKIGYISKTIRGCSRGRIRFYFPRV